MKKKNIIIITLIILGIISIFGLSYAYFVSNISTENKDNSNTSISTGSTVEAILEIPSKGDDTKIIPGYKTSKEYIVRGKGDSNSIPTEASLVVNAFLEDFKNVVKWKLYKSDEEITCTRKLDTTSLEIKYISNCNIPDNATLVLDSDNSYLINYVNLTINYNTNDKYYLVTEYIDTNEDQSDLMDKSFSIDVSLEKKINSVEDNILASLDTTGKCPTVNDDGSVNVTSIEDENSLLCSAPDSYGVSYYYRGNVTNNYVKFAGYYWRILRINGDGTIRLIYDGKEAHQNGESSEDRVIGTSAFNESYDDNAYVGYMYGTPGSSSYDETHANINDSTIKKYIDTWYENNLKNTTYEEYLADNTFCNDRSLTSNETGFNNLGYGKDNTGYRWHGWYDTNIKIKLTCTKQHDNFSVSDLEYGNGALKYPIAIISSDEAYLAGGKDVANEKYYLYSVYFWTMSPFEYYDEGVKGRVVKNDGTALDWAAIYDTKVGVKPVINLNKDSIRNGLGTIEVPFVIE